MKISDFKKITVDIAVPVYNEQKQLEKNITALQTSIKTKKELARFSFQILIVDNGSTDSTPKIAKKLASQNKHITFNKISKKGRGKALRYAWKKSQAKIVSYMDIDLSADLAYLASLLKMISSGQADVAIGSRLAQGSKVSGRTLAREFMSRSYNFLIRLMFQTKFKDAQCGFKAIGRKTFQKLEPFIKNQNWFFDSELLIIAEKSGFKIQEVPIIWTDDPSSTVKVASTALEDIMGLIRLKINKPWKKIEKQEHV